MCGMCGGGVKRANRVCVWDLIKRGHQRGVCVWRRVVDGARWVVGGCGGVVVVVVCVLAVVACGRVCKRGCGCGVGCCGWCAWVVWAIYGWVYVWAGGLGGQRVLSVVRRVVYGVCCVLRGACCALL